MVPFQPKENWMGKVPDVHPWPRLQVPGRCCRAVERHLQVQAPARGCSCRHAEQMALMPQRAGGCSEPGCGCPGSCHAQPTAAGTRCAGHPQMSALLPVTSSDSLLVLLGNTKKRGLCQKLCNMNSARKIHICVKR